MKEAYLGAAELTANTTYDREYSATKRIFRSTKEDLV